MIILVDDDKPVIELFRAMLKNYKGETGEVLCRNDGVDVLPLIQQTQADGGKIALIISDIEMPYKDGIQMTREIRAFEEKAEVKEEDAIFILLQSSDTKYKEEALEAGANVFFQKGEMRLKQFYSLLDEVL